MKTKYVLFSVIMVIVLTLTTFGQLDKMVKPNHGINQSNISDSMGKPIFESTVDSLNTKFWILSQMKYKEMLKTNTGAAMGKMKDKNVKMDKATKEAVMKGTHYFIFDVSNISNGKEFADTSAKVEIVSPTKEVTSVNLQPMMNHFGGGISLVEKGDYLFTINLNIGMGYKTTQFKYKVR
jgi:hypothetical protein